ncbi:MAG: hypothetical protein JXR77_16585 [Lentisphaeria bacterium]|nr:hypothetical protein [Lentisphaeria bacterium]
MIPEQQLVQRIVDLIHSDQLERNPVLEEFAEQYAELCQDLVARLQRCAEYLDRGMRSEAVHEATSAPSVLELVEVVRFPELKKWGNIVTDLELAPFPQLPMDIVEKLRQECATEADLAPLLKEYRRCVYQGDQEGSIRALRTLREKDPGNPSWPENLRPLEEARLPHLLHAADAALAQGDLNRLRELHADMTHAQRCVPVPEDALERVRDALLARRRAETAALGADLCRRVRGALDEGEAGALAPLLEEWETLRGDEAFRPTGSMESVLAEARARHGEWVREREAADAFAGQVQELRHLLANRGATAAAIRSHFEGLTAAGMPLPAGLRDEVSGALARLAARRRRRTQLVVLAVCLLVAVAGCAAGFWVLQKRVQTRRRAQVQEMGLLLERREYDRLRTVIETLRNRDPALYASADVRHLAEQAEAALRRKAELDRQLQSVLVQLGRIREEGYGAEEEAIRRLLAEARQVASDEVADKSVDAWQAAWDEWRLRRRRQANAEAERITALIVKILEDRRARPFASLADEETALQRVEPLVREGETAISGAATEAVNAFHAAAVDVQGWRRDFEQRRGARRERLERLEALRQAVQRAPPDLAAYRESLQRLVEEFPEEPDGPACRRVLAQMEACIKAEALKAFQLLRLPPNREAERALRLLAAGEPMRGAVWEPDVRAAISYLDANARLRLRLPALVAGKSDMLLVHVLHYRAKGSDAWRPLYHPSPLMSRRETDENGEFTVYWGNVYYWETDDEAPHLVHTSKAFPNKLTTRDFDIRIESRPQDNVVAHGRFLYRFVTEAAEAAELDVHVLNGLQTLIEDREMAPVPRAWLVKRLVHLLDEHFPAAIPEAREMVQRVDTMQTEVPWMNARHPEVTAAAAAITEVLAGLAEIPPLVARVQAERAVLAASLSRLVHSVGCLRPGADGQPRPEVAGANPGRVWVLSETVPGVAASFRVAARRAGADGPWVVDPAVGRELFEGQVLFAPGDGRTEAALIEAAVPEGLRPQVHRPSSWPVNAWIER